MKNVYEDDYFHSGHHQLDDKNKECFDLLQLRLLFCLQTSYHFQMVEVQTYQIFKFCSQTFSGSTTRAPFFSKLETTTGLSHLTPKLIILKSSTLNGEFRHFSLFGGTNRGPKPLRNFSSGFFFSKLFFSQIFQFNHPFEDFSFDKLNQTIHCSEKVVTSAKNKQSWRLILLNSMQS